MLSRRSTVWSTVLVLVSVLLSLFASAAPAGAAGPVVVYDSIPTPLPGNYPSLAFEANGISGFADDVRLAGGPRTLNTVTVGMSTWAPITDAPGYTNPGPWTDPTGWNHPFTVTLYQVSGLATAPVLGSVIATTTQTQKVPWRPNHTTACPGNSWSPLGNGDNTSCFNGFAFSLDFDFSASPVALPGRVAVAIAYSTQHYGPNQITGSGPYNSLNVGFAGTGAVKGTDLNSTGVFYDTGTGLVFGSSAAVNVPTFRITASGPDATNVTVTAGQPHGWGFFYDSGSGPLAGSYRQGPATPPIGHGSARLVTTVSTQGPALAVIPSLGSTRLDQLSELTYSTYRSSTDAGNNLAISLQFPIDFNLNDFNFSNQGRLVYEPYNTYGGGVPQGQWKTWDTLGGKWWSSSLPSASTCGIAHPCTLTELLTTYPNAGIRINPFSGLYLKAGSGWATFDGNADALRVGVAGVTTVYDFEDAPCSTDCYVSPSGDDLNGGASYADAKKTIQAAIDAVNVGGTVHVDNGTYAESPNITKSLTLISRNGRNSSTINLQTGPTYLGSLTVGGVASDVTINGFTIVGRDGASPVLAATNILVNPGVHDVTITNNRLRVGVIDGGSNNDDGVGILTTYAPTDHVHSLSVTNNLFVPLNSTGTRAFFVNPGTDGFTFTGNSITGNFAATGVTQARNGLVEGNTVTGTGASASIGSWGYPDAAEFGHTTFRANTISATSVGFRIAQSSDVTIEHNVVSNVATGVQVDGVGCCGPVTNVDGSTVIIRDNSFTGITGKYVTNTYPTAVNASANWWGSTNTDGSNITGPVDFTPVLTSGTDTLPAAGFQGSIHVLKAHTSGAQSGTEGRVQEGIDLTDTDGTVNVAPGTYDETATGRSIDRTSDTGLYQYGVYFPPSKSGVTLQGITDLDAPITSSSATLATIRTRATNNFGPSGIFVAGDDSTIRGLTVGTNLVVGENGSRWNKTIEVIADGFSLLDSHMADAGGVNADTSVGYGVIYVSDFRTALDPYHVATYRFERNHFDLDNSILLASGAGHSAAASLGSRTIVDNEFDGAPNTLFISFRGQGGQPWYSYPVGGATIAGNTFGPADINIRATGIYDESEFHWDDWRDDNTFARLVWVEDQNTGNLQTFTYGPYTNVRQLGGRIDSSNPARPAGVDIAVAGDTVHVHTGTYPEQAILDKAGITVDGYDAPLPVVDDGAATSGNGLTILANNVTVSDLVVQRYNVGIAVPTGPIHDVQLKNVDAVDNGTHGVFVQASPLTDFTVDGGHYSRNDLARVANGRGIWIINGVKTRVTLKDLEAKDNGLVGLDVSDGSVTGLSITGNTVTGNGDSGIAFLGATGAAANLVSNNTVTNNGRYGIEVKNADGNGAVSGAGSVVVSNNTISRTLAATDTKDFAGIAVIRRSPIAPNVDQPHGVVITGNTISGYAVAGTGDGFGIVVEGLDQTVTKNTMTGNDVGVQTQAGQPLNVQGTDGFDRGTAADFGGHVNNNNISLSNTVGFRAVGLSSAADGECNWWDAANGPSTVGLGSGAPVSTNVDFIPWLITADLDGTCPSIAVVTPATTPLDQDEGTLFSNSGAFTDMGTVVTADNTLGTLVDNGDGTWTWTLLATDPLNDGPTSGTIVVTGTASNGSSTTTSFAYSIANVAPTATFNVPTQVAAGDTYGLSFTLPVEPSAGDTLSYTFTCGANPPVTSAASSIVCPAATVAQIGTSIPVSGSVDDDDGGTTPYTGSVLVVPATTLAPPTKDFGDTDLGATSGVQTFTLTNNTNHTLNVQAVGFFLGDTSQFVLSNNLCDGVAVASLGTCTFDVAFQPTGSAGVRNSTVSVRFNAPQPAGERPTSSLTGTAVVPAAPIAAIDPTTFTYPTTTIGTSASHAFTITNNGNAALHISSASISGSPRFSVVSGGTCGVLPATVVAGDSCTIHVEFAPTGVSAVSGSLIVNTDGGNVSAALDGDGVLAPVPAATVTPASPFDFGDVDVAAVPPTQTFTVTNSGQAGSGLIVSAVSISGSSTFSVTPVSLPVTLGTSDHQDIVVTFDPTSAGVRNATLLITTNVGTQVISLTGNGTVTPPPAPIAGLPTGADDPVDFGNVPIGSSHDVLVPLTNTGTAVLNVSAISVTGSGAFTVAAGQCPTVAVSGTCDVTVTFTPTALGTRNATLHVASDGGNPTVGLTGVGIQGPTAAVTPNTWDFTVNLPTPDTDVKSFQVQNTGYGTFTVGSPTTTGSAWFTVTGNTCSAPLAHNDTCAVEVTFTATGAADKNGTLHIPSDAANGEVTAALHGTANGPAVSTAQLTPSSRDFGDVLVGHTRTRTFTLKNVGTANLTGISVDLANDTTFTKSADTCTGPVAPNATCTFDITFAPTDLSHSSDTITVASNASNGDETAEVEGDGVDVSPVAKVTPDSGDFADTVVGSNDDIVFTLKNNGTGTLTGIVLSVTGSNFSIDSDTCASTLGEGLTCDITVRFAPGSAGNKSGTLKVASTNAANGDVAVPLSGLGVAAPSSVSITPNPYDFGQVERGLTVNKTFTFHNNGVGSIHVVSVDKASGSSAFTIPSGNDECSGENVAGGGTCTFRVSFKAPTSTDVKHARVDVSGTGFAVESLDVTGQGVPFVAKVDAYLTKATSNKDYVGQGIFCADICNQQSVSRSVSQGDTFTYRVKIKNVANGVDSIKARLNQGGSKAIVKSIKVLLNGNTDVTKQFVNGGYTIRNLRPGSYAYFWVQIKLTPNAHIGNTNAIVIAGRSVRQSSVKDVVQAKTTAKH